MKFKSVIYFLLFLSLITGLSAQEKPRIAVLQFSAISVSETDAKALSGLFETALVKTEAYNVLE